MSKLLSPPNFIVFLLIAVAALFLFNAAAGDSAIFDETAHIVAGYTYVRHLDYRFNPEHPPLVKILAGLPLLFQNLSFSTEKGYWGGLNEQWWAGNEFLYKSGNDADTIIFWARVGPILLALLLIWFTYYFAKELVGRWWALLPAFLAAFSPIVLAHGHYLTTDVGATLGMMMAIYWFLKFLFDPSRKNLVYAGLAFGIAQAIKFSAVLLIPYFFFVALVFKIFKDGIPASKYLGNAILVMLIGYFAVVYPLYLVTTWNYPIEKQIADTETLLQGFGVRPLADLAIQMAHNRLTRPFAEYLLGVLMVLQRSAGGNNAFFLGQLSAQGWWYYFPLIYLMKEPIPHLLIIGLSGFLALMRMIGASRNGIRNAYRKFTEYVQVHFAEFAILVFVALYWLSSITSPLNIGVRHVLPTLPLFYILATGSLRKWFSSYPYELVLDYWQRLENYFHSLFSFWIKTVLLSTLIIWAVAEAFIAAPHFLSYFNELAGGPKDGFYYATDSNFDWGQDVKRLTAWTKEHLGSDEKIAVDYFGGGDPAYYLGGQFVPWWSAKGSPADEDINWLAISANTLQGALATPVAGFYKNPADEYRWLENPYGFIDRAGTSIFIYRLAD
jgi:4-amino-4-deoxy-L-arabinose transferase-like glycosyltransferase